MASNGYDYDDPGMAARVPRAAIQAEVDEFAARLGDAVTDEEWFAVLGELSAALSYDRVRCLA
jgi:hypothetical protein